ncbi:hypothetical protein ACLOJK_016154 [Asimina triloba]
MDESRAQTDGLCFSFIAFPPTLHPNPINPSFRRPTILQPPIRIPGPAGSVQAVMHREALRAKICVPGSGCEEADDDDDEDLKLNSWLCALDFLGWDARAPLSYSIRTSQAMERIPLGRLDISTAVSYAVDIASEKRHASH